MTNIVCLSMISTCFLRCNSRLGFGNIDTERGRRSYTEQQQLRRKICGVKRDDRKKMSEFREEIEKKTIEKSSRTQNETDRGCTQNETDRGCTQNETDRGCTQNETDRGCTQNGTDRGCTQNGR